MANNTVSTYEVKNSNRYKIKAINAALGTNLVRYLVELLTNSDDSYRRLENKNSEIKDIPKPIYIELAKDRRVDKGSNIVIVTDNAEGMDEVALQKNFEFYEDDKAGGSAAGVRGLYGRGASDVLRAASYNKKLSQIISIKDDTIYKLKYMLVNEADFNIRIEKITKSKSAMENFRKSMQIPENGTRVEFGIPESVKTNIKKLKDLIEAYPALHYLLNTSNREFYFIQKGKEPVLLSSKQYSFDNMKFLAERDFDYDFNGETLKCKLKIYRNPNKDNNKLNILVIDEKQTYFDNTMFDFSNNPGAKDLSGELIIYNLYDLCYRYLNGKPPVALFLENRDGFDTKNDFYKGLNRLVSPIIMQLIKEFGRKSDTTNLMKSKDIAEVVRGVNEYLTEEKIEEIPSDGTLEGQEPPAEGLKFVRNNATITKGKTYDLNLLINSNLIKPSDMIGIEMEENENIAVTPVEVKYDEKDKQPNGLVIKHLTITAIKETDKDNPIIIQAKFANYLAIIAINVLKQDIHIPKDGFEFFKNELILTVNTKHKAKLYFDKNIIPIGTKILVTSVTGLTIKNTKNSYVETTEEDLLDDNIGCIEIVSEGGEIGEKHVIDATIFEPTNYHGDAPLPYTSVKISIIAEKEHNPKQTGFISGIVTEKSPQNYYRTYFNPVTHTVVINTTNPVNKAFLPKLPELDDDNPKFSKDELKYIKVLIAHEAAVLYVNKKHVAYHDIPIESGKEDLAFQDYSKLIQQQETIIFNRLNSD